MDLYIVDALLIVHRDPECPEVPALARRRRTPVTRNQVLVHRRKMPPCHSCWPDLREFEALVLRADTAYPSKARVDR